MRRGLASGQKIALGAALALTLALLAALMLLAKPMYPLPRGNSADFWYGATCAKIRPTDISVVSACFVGDFAYYRPASMDSAWTYWLPKEEAMRDYPLVIQSLEASAADANDDWTAARGYRRFKALPATQQSVDALILSIEDEKARRLLANPELSPGSLAFESNFRQLMLEQAQRSRRYWANGVIEFLWLDGLIWFALWPVIRGESAWRLALHMAAVPFLFLLPTWLGYCTVAAGGVGPAGGIVYPWLTFFIQCVPWHGEVWFYRATPAILDSMNQCPEWSLDEALSSLRFVRLAPGPLHAAIASAALVCTALGMRYLAYHARLSRLRRPGFEVVPPVSSHESKRV